MKKVFFVFVGVMLTINASANSSDGIQIVCEKVSDATFENYTLYKTPPKTIEEHALNIIRGDGVGALLIEKPKRITYVLKEGMNRIENTDGTTQFGGANIEINRHHVKAGNAKQVLNINRVTGEMKHTFILSDETMASWKSKHGGTPPKFGTWHYQCNKSSSAF